MLRNEPTRVRISVHATYYALLEDEGSLSYRVLNRIEHHASWSSAARAALSLADRLGYCVVNRAIIEHRLGETP